MSIIASPPNWTNSAGMLTPAGFPIFSALNVASTSSLRIGYSSSSDYLWTVKYCWASINLIAVKV